jgi:hypothetical protein
MSDYGNQNTDVTCTTGGSNRVTIPAGTKIRGGTGTDGSGSVPCRYCRIQVASTNSTISRVRIGSECTDVTGVVIPSYPSVTPYAVDDLNKLYFYGTSNDVIDIEYFK